MQDNGAAGASGRPGGWLLGGLALAGAAVGGTALLRRFDAFALQAITQPERRQATASPADFGLAYDEVALRSEDEVDLFGWLIHAPGGPAAARATLILGHGISDTASALIGFAAWMQAAGYNILLLDWRAHGRSGGDRCSVGYLEHQDVGAALRYLAGRGLDAVGIQGWSLGGAVAIVSAALYPQIAGVIADSTFARLASPLARAGRLYLHYPAWAARLAGLYGERLVARSLGYNATDAQPQALVARISPRPIFIIHSEEDDLVPVDNAYNLYARAREPKELWVSRAGAHVVGPNVAFPAEYRARVLGFWDTVFAARPARVAV